ncbi:MAG: trimethylamine methyltransferase family protein, partial [Arenicellales bacterium]|nr:trimethylamine methyltransferase family protein [Arenicellales bacterium]
MARRTRTARDRSKRSANTSLSGHIRRSLPFFEVLKEEQIVCLEMQVDWIMQDVGIAFRDDPEALQLWQQHGARIEGDIVRAPADWVRNLCS